MSEPSTSGRIIDPVAAPAGTGPAPGPAGTTGPGEELQGELEPLAGPDGEDTDPDADAVDADVVEVPASSPAAAALPAAPQPAASVAGEPTAGRQSPIPPAGPFIPANLSASVLRAITPPVVPPMAPTTNYTDAGVPTLDFIRDKIESRHGRALGAAELARRAADLSDQAAGRKTAAERQAERDQAAADRLEQIRRSLHQDG